MYFLSVSVILIFAVFKHKKSRTYARALVDQEVRAILVVLEVQQETLLLNLCLPSLQVLLSGPSLHEVLQ